MTLSNYDRLNKEFNQLKSHQSSLNWVLNILKGASDTKAKVIIGVKQETGATHEAVLCDADTDIAKQLIGIFENTNISYLNRMDDITKILTSIDNLLKDK